MNREIEFRAWLKEKKQMVRVRTICLEKKGTIIVYDTIKREGVFLFDEIELMQYTGLKDKNGVKIFEGDIIKTTDDCLGVIEFDTINASFAIRWFDEDGESYLEDLVFMNVDKLEFIGNIYENKELLEGE